MYNSRYLIYEQPQNSKYAEYGQVTEVMNDKLFNVAMSGEANNILEAVTAQAGYVPKLGDWVTVSWIAGNPVGQGGNASNGLTNINDGVTVVSQGDVADGVINSDHIRANSIQADHISANSVTAYAISANSIQAYHLSASSVTADAISANSITTSHLTTNSVTADKIAVGAITADSISANSITSDKISANAITSDKISADSITSDMIKSNSIISDKIDSDAIESRHISSNVIQSTMIQASQIQAYHLSANSVTSDAISANSIRADHITAGAITTDKVNANAITSMQISSNSIMSYHISSNQIDTQHISAGAVTADKIASNSITAQQISANSITSYLISAGSITTSLISAGAITSNLISANSVQTQHISANSIQTNQIKAGSITTNLITANAITSNLIQSQAIQSQHISSNAIQANMISANQIQTQHISANSINSNQITANAIQSKHISSNTITSVMIQAGQITTNLISANSITSNLISSNAIQSQHISANSITATQISANAVQTQHISANTITGQQIKAGAITAQNISAGTITSDLISSNTITGQQISGGSITTDLLSVGARKSGLLAQYYAYSSNSVNKFQIYKGSQVDQVIDFNWSTGSPSLVGQSDYFAVRWQGYLTAPESGTFTFGVVCDDTMKVTVNNVIVINQTSATTTEKQGTIQLTKDSMYSIVVEYTETTGSANAHLYWTRPSGTHEVVPSLYLSQGTTVVDGSQISTGSIQASAIAVGTITAQSGILANAVIQTANIGDGIITSAKIGDGEIQSVNIASGNIQTIHIASEAVDSSKIKSLTADKISGGYISASLISGGTITGAMIAGQTISGGNVKAGTIDSLQIKSGAITADKLSAGSITTDKIEAGAITSDLIRAGSIESQHISTIGLDAQLVTVYNSATGETLMGGGYLRVDGLDVGVVQSDNLLANGLFLTPSSSYGYKRNNPTEEILLGSSAGLIGADQIWKYDLISGTVVNQIDINGKKPYDIVIHPSGNFAYVTVQGDNTLVQIDLMNDVATNDTLPMGTGPARAKFTGMELMDMKHIFVLNTDANDDMIPDSITIIDTPPDSVDSELYIHHKIALGNNPIDFVVDGNGLTYITMGTQGDVVMIDTSKFNSANWKVKGRIPISAYGTDNYHGGLPAQYGLQEVTGGDASSQYNDNSSMGGMSGMSMGMDAPSGYGASDGTLRTYEPHGIELSSDPNTLYVLDNVNGELVVIDKYGNAPYNALIGTGPPNANQSAPSSSSSMGGMSMTSGSSMTSGGSMDMTGGVGSTGDGDPAMFKQAGEVAGGGPTTTWVRYRIPVGDSPEFIKLINGKLFITANGSGDITVIDEQDILNEIQADNNYYGAIIDDQDTYQNWNITDPMRTVNTIPVRTISNVGAKPLFIEENGGLLYVSLSGQNQIAVIDPNMEMVTKKINTGANPKGMAFTPDGRYMYFTNFGGESDLSFVYPQGSYIGDAYLGIEGGVKYQGGDSWTPDRSNWVYDASGNIQSQSTVNFHINEPFLNEGGYVALSTVGVDYQYAQIEQDIINVTNYSNGNNTIIVKAEKIYPSDSNNTIFYSKNDFATSPVPSNIKYGYTLSGNDILTSANSNQYTIHYGQNNDSYIQFSGGVVPSGGFVELDYTGLNNIYFRPHNGSIEVAIENGSSPNFSTLFEIDEYVPKFVAIDNKQTSNFTPTQDGINEEYTGLEYSIMTNRASMLMSGNITHSGGSIYSGNVSMVVDGSYASGNQYLGLSSGNSYVQLDLGKAYMVGMINVWHYWDDGRTFHKTKTQVSEDGTTWVTVFDSTVSGEYSETSDGHMIMFDAIPVRYVRDWTNGNTVDANNIWKEIQVFGDWEVIYNQVYPNNSTYAGQQIATNGKSYVETDISGAYIAVDIATEFTTFWYMTYIVGPQYGKLKVDMPTLMASSHFLELSAPYVNKIAHRHLMSYPPSENVPANDMLSIKAGKHRAVIRQVSGRISFDRFRFEDFQYYQRNSLLIPTNTSATVFKRYKFVAEQAKYYKGIGIQATEGAYDSPRVNPDSGLPDQSVPIKYRFRIKSELSPEGNVQERGIAYATSGIMETGRLSTHWRRSEASDLFPANRIETWDSNLPHDTGIQSAHLAVGSVSGDKIMPLSIMDWHISNYARIQEHKLQLDYPTHQHGHYITIPNAGPMGMDLTVFQSNKDFLDSIDGFAGISGNYGSGNTVSRGDHNHDDRYLKINGGSVTGNTSFQSITATSESHFSNGTFVDPKSGTNYGMKVSQGIATDSVYVTGNITITGTVDGVDVSTLNTTVTNHIGSGGSAHALVVSSGNAGFISGTDKAKLDAIQVNSINQTSADARYLKLAGGTLTGNVAFQNDGLGVNFYGGASIYKQAGSGLKLKAHSDSVGIAFQNTSGNDVLIVKTDGTTMTYYGNQVWHAGNLVDPATGTWISGNYYNKSYIDGKLIVATESGNGLLSSTDKTKLDGIQSSAINQATADGRYLQLSGGTVTGAIVHNNNSPLQWKNTSGTIYTLVNLDSSNHVQIGSSSEPMYLNSSVAPIYVSGSTNYTLWHGGNLVSPATTTWVSGNYYNMSTVDQKIASAGNVDATKSNTFNATNTFNYSGLAIKVQPSSNVSNSTKLIQVNDYLSNELFSVNASGGIFIKGDFNVQGTQTFNGTTTVAGDYSISGNLYVSGSSTLGDTPTDITTVNGSLVVNGAVKEVGQYVEVHRRPLFGIGGDLQFQTSDTTFDNVGSVNYNPSTYANPTVQSGATRYYRLYVIYSDDISTTQATGGQKGTLRLSGNSTGTVVDFDLTSTWGDPNARKDLYTSYFTNLPNEHVQLQASLAQSGNNLGIRWVELIAYDKF